MQLIDCQRASMTVFGRERGFQPTDAFFYVLEGSFSLTVDGETRTVASDELVFFPHDMPFERRILSPLTFYYVKLIPNAPLPRGVQPVQNRVRLLSTLSLLDTAVKAEGQRELAEHFLRDVFRQLEAEARLTPALSDRVAEQAIRYLKERLSQKIALAQVASAVGLSVSGLTERFKAATGTTPMRYLTVMRLKKAEELLVTTDESLAEIAAACGYDNAFYLSNAFKKEKGEAPRRYRQKYRI